MAEGFDSSTPGCLKLPGAARHPLPTPGVHPGAIPDDKTLPPVLPRCQKGYDVPSWLGADKADLFNLFL